MPSLFSRSRTFSTPNKKPSTQNLDGAYDEFGRSASRQGAATPSKKDKKSAKRAGTLPNNVPLDHESAYAQFPDGAFLPLNLERPRTDTPDAQPGLLAPPKAQDHDYGYLCHERHVVLGLDQLERLVDVVANELETRGGITTPFIFNNTALDISAGAIKRLVHAFLATCAPSSEHDAQVAELKWMEEARFAGPHELGMCLRWGLARVIRSVGGQDVRGLVSWEHYTEWRDAEAALQYPPTHFQSFLPALPPPLQFIIVRLLSLLARLVANSTSSGHTPPTLSPLFGPLFFGLGPPTLAFHHAYIHYLRAANAMEHLILAFIRWQDAPRTTTGSGSALGVPIRLKEWIKGYPASLPFLQNPKAKPQPRKGSKTVRVLSVRRNVRMYSADLVKSASTWGHKTPTSTIQGSFALSKEWERIAPSTLKLPPRYSDAYKKRMNMSNSFHPEVAPGSYAPSLSSTGASSSAGSPTAPSLSLSTTTDSASSEYFGLGIGAGAGERPADKFRSLTDMKWGEFEDMGFGNTNTESKLQFDLTESARQERKSKRQTLDWNDFSSAGFSRMDAPLSATLQFSTPVINTVQSWPTQQAEIHKKLKKQQKALPSFGWDTEPVIGNEEVIEASFLDVFCDLVYGGGWMDLERGEALDRDCNWALVEYKSLPPSRSTVVGGSDPRTDTTLILFEEFVPLEYRQQLAIPAKARRRLPSLFSPGKPKGWKQAATLNGRPYVVGSVPRSPSYREVEFEGMLSGSSGTKMLSLSSARKDAARVQSVVGPSASAQYQQPQQQPSLPIPPQPNKPAPTLTTTSAFYAPMGATEAPSDVTDTPTKSKSRFRLPVSPSVRRSSMIPPAEYSSVDFQTRMASSSSSDDEGPPSDLEDEEAEAARQRRRESRSDAWVDILVGSQTRRMDEQAAERLSPAERRKARVNMGNRRSDPDLASLEVAQVLASVGVGEDGVRPASPSFGADDDNERVDRDYGMDAHLYPDERDRRRFSDGATSESSGLAYDRSSVGHDTAEDEVLAPIVSVRQMAKEQRRLGYFDLHPERRPVSLARDEDPRARFGRDEESDEETDEGAHNAAAATQPLRPLPVPPAVTVTPEPSPPRKVAVPDVKITTGLPSTPNGKLAQTQTTPSKQPAAQEPVAPAKTPTGGRTAALIEMYRERERSGGAGGAAQGSVVPSLSSAAAPLNVASPTRLPVRSASLPGKEGVSAPAASATTTTLPSKIPTPGGKGVGLPASPSPRVGNGNGVKAGVDGGKVGASTTTTTPTPSPPEVVLGVPLEDPGRVSPMRYVHGAPLHNVMEEEEEE